MLFYSTKNQEVKEDFVRAIFMGPSKDGGLFMPAQIPALDPDWITGIEGYTLQEIARKVIAPYIGIASSEISGVVERAFIFPAPVRRVGHHHFLELFHGPTLAFKDFGARFMAQAMSYFRKKDENINILVATSGDTGGAVASAFSGLEGFKVFILFPKNKVSPLQQRQLTTWDDNVIALEVEGNFDDCQRLVKMAFSDQALRNKKIFASANSINIARLLPQMVYYFEAFKQATLKSGLNIIVPSGNFGNLTAGLLAKRMGLPISHFTAATNNNDIIPLYLLTGKYSPRVSRETLSNAMDVGDPSNFVRMLDLYRGRDESSTWNNMKKDLNAHVVDDKTTLQNIREVFERWGYIMDPHTAVAYDAAKMKPGNNIIVSTAHWAKFAETIEKAIGALPPIPGALSHLMDKTEKVIPIQARYEDLLGVIGGK
ncbi:MAG TPA: threonine synthase [Saprospiraceae bacterium]|nr:threonine synthase [Saprospiraceae bacterium]HNT20998.1 threonine synthase [Saprospiraceae bacterium]